jgi:hypothetical protein
VSTEPEHLAAVPEDIRNYILLEEIFMPFASKARRQLYAPGKFTSATFVHYTSAEAALNIIKSKRLWLRNATCMTDYREVQHGFDMLKRVFDIKENEEAFAAALDECHKGVAKEAIAHFNHWLNDLRSQTFIASVSVHDEQREGQHGRLSMWRAMAVSPQRVAIVFRAPWHSGAFNLLNLAFSPVAYYGDNEVQAEFRTVIENIRANAQFVRETSREQVAMTVFSMLASGVVCLKHEGFREEAEWRIVYGPGRQPSRLMENERETRTVGGVPQLIYKIPLDKSVSGDLSSLDVAHIFDRLIVGPSQYSWSMWQAFVSELTNAGVADAADRVVLSGIPIRA